MSTTLLDEPTTRPATNSVNPAQRLRTTMAAVRVAFTWFGTPKHSRRPKRARPLTRSAPKGSSYRQAKN